jgi:hypothetical protein
LRFAALVCLALFLLSDRAAAQQRGRELVELVRIDARARRTPPIDQASSIAPHGNGPAPAFCDDPLTSPNSVEPVGYQCPCQAQPPVWTPALYPPGASAGLTQPPMGPAVPPATLDPACFLPVDCGRVCLPPAGDWLWGGRWYALADAIALKRDQSGDVPFATLDNNVVLSTRQQDFPFRYGARFLVGRTISNWLRVEGLYLGLLNWSEQRSVRDDSSNVLGGTGNLFSRLSNFGNPTAISGVDYNQLATIDYFSTLDNVELNLRHRLVTPPYMEVSFLWGVRYINVSERFKFFTSAEVPSPLGATNFVQTNTQNNLAGLQVGGTANVPIEDAWWISLDVKGALCQNFAQQHTDYVNTTNGATQTASGQRSIANSAFVGDLALAINCQCGEHLIWRCGYQALWLTDLVLASENVPNNLDILTLGPAQIDHTGRVVYHGPHAGVIVTW